MISKKIASEDRALAISNVVYVCAMEHARYYNGENQNCCQVEEYVSMCNLTQLRCNTEQTSANLRLKCASLIFDAKKICLTWRSLRGGS